MTIHGIGMLDLDTPPVRPIRLWDCGVTWKDINPAKGVWVWDRLDAFAAMPGRHLLVLGSTPAWAARVPTQHSAPWIGPGSSSPPRSVHDWDAYVRHVVTRYPGRFDYEIWNEPQLQEFWAPITEVSRLAVMTGRAYRIIKEADPDARVISAAVLPRTSSGGMKRGARYLRALGAVNWPVDAFAYHAYPEQGTGPKRFAEMTRDVKAALRALSAPERPLWCTEVNYNLLGGPIPDMAVEPYMRATDKACEAASVKRCYWYAYKHGDPTVLGIPFTEGSLGTRMLRTL